MIEFLTTDQTRKSYLDLLVTKFQQVYSENILR